jgi:hypothetical protein
MTPMGGLPSVGESLQLALLTEPESSSAGGRLGAPPVNYNKHPADSTERATADCPWNT